MHEVRYNRVWANINLVAGILISIILFLGFLTFQTVEHFLQFFAGLLVIAIGIYLRTQPSIQYDDHQIVIISYFKITRRTYSFKDKREVIIRNGRPYLNNKKIQANKFMLNLQEWERFLAFYSPEDENLMSELQD